MIRLVSCGIETYNEKEDILCAKQDAELIYNAFQHLFPDFDNPYSITLYNARAEEFQRAVKNAGKDLGNTDVLVIYFSGHAAKECPANEFILFFQDEDFVLRHLIDITIKFKCHKLLILDCCFAGQAVSLANFKQPGLESFFVLSAVGPYSFAEYKEACSPFTQCLVNCLNELDSTNQAITLTRIRQALEKNSYHKSTLAIAVGKTDLFLKDATSTDGNMEFLAAFWDKLPTLSPSMRAIMWYALDSSNLSYDIKVKIIERLYNSRPRFYEGSWIVRRAIGHMLGELPQQESKVKKIEENLLNSKSWIDICIGLVATRTQNTSQIQELRRNICSHPEHPMDVIWLANLYYADHFTENREDGPGDEIFFPQKLCETAWGIEDLFARYKKHPSVLAHLETAAGEQFHDAFQTQKKMFSTDTFPTTNLLLDTYLKCPRRGRNTASFRDKWLRSVLFGQWRDHPLADRELEIYFQNTKLENCQRDLMDLSSATVDIKLSILGYVSSFPPNKRKKYQNALSWALEDPHPWVRRDSFIIFSDDLERIKEHAFCDTINRDHYPGVLDMIIEADAISKNPDWKASIKKYCEKIEFCEAEIKAIESYLK